jgi:hypothetical protein
MCHDVYHSSERLKDEIARELLDDEDLAEAVATAEPADGGVPSFLNEERETDVDILTDGGTEE